MLSELPNISGYELRKAELHAYLRYLLLRPTPPGTRFVVFANYRTGSRLLTGLLDSHPLIRCEQELLLPFMRPRRRKVLFPHLLVKSRYAGVNKDLYGWSLKLDQLLKVLIREIHGTPARFMRKLHVTGWKILYLSRRNVVRQALSNIIANTRGIWHHDRSENWTQHEKIGIDCRRWLWQIEWLENMHRLERKALKGIPYFPVFYERDLLRADIQQATMDRVFEYLGIPTAAVQASTFRISSDRLADHVQNYDELVEAVRGTKYEEMLLGP